MTNQLQTNQKIQQPLQQVLCRLPTVTHYLEPQSHQVFLMRLVWRQRLTYHFKMG